MGFFAKKRNDYYPFGMPMPNRDLVGDYRYKFQGQEKDPETGKEAFQLRLWDARIGRWLTTDPYRQYNSPYVGMGNDPINGIDPDGGLFGRIRAWIHKQFNGGSMHQRTDGKWAWKKGTGGVAALGDGDGDGDLTGLTIQYKNFGHGGLGKASFKNSTYQVNSKIDFGFVYSRDNGATGITLKGPTLTLLESKIGYDSEFVNEMYWVGKDRKFKGSLYSIRAESPVVDYKAGRKWDVTGRNSPVGIFPVSQTNDYAGVGRPYLELKVDDISKKGLSVHLGLQEEFGRSVGLFDIFGISGKAGFKIQINFEWEF